MNCLGAEKIYLYLENELDEAERKKIDQHIVSCSDCRMAVEERRIFLKASSTLPQWDVPENFTQKVMAGIPMQKTSLKSAVKAAAIVFSSLISLIFIYLFLTGETLFDFFKSINSTVLSMLQSISVAAVRIYKIASVAVKTIGDLFSFLFNTLLKFMAIISPEIMISLFVISFIISIALFITLRKKFFTGERT